MTTGVGENQVMRIIEDIQWRLRRRGIDEMPEGFEYTFKDALYVSTRELLQKLNFGVRHERRTFEWVWVITVPKEFDVKLDINLTNLR
ncbi:MAG: hypothetical protein IKP28_06675 [Clostridia bacterium]|nr:hypothetical protein [Clostridia bacterium]